MNQKLLLIQEILNRPDREIRKPRTELSHTLEGATLGTLVLFDTKHLPLPEEVGVDHPYENPAHFLRCIKDNMPLILLAVILPFNNSKELRLVGPSENYLPFQIGYLYCDEDSIKAHYGRISEFAIHRAHKLFQREVLEVVNPLIIRAKDPFDPDDISILTKEYA